MEPRGGFQHGSAADRGGAAVFQLGRVGTAAQEVCESEGAGGDVGDATQPRFQSTVSPLLVSSEKQPKDRAVPGGEARIPGRC